MCCALAMRCCQGKVLKSSAQPDKTGQVLLYAKCKAKTYTMQKRYAHSIKPPNEIHNVNLLDFL